MNGGGLVGSSVCNELKQSVLLHPTEMRKRRVLFFVAMMLFNHKSGTWAPIASIKRQSG